MNKQTNQQTNKQTKYSGPVRTYLDIFEPTTFLSLWIRPQGPEEFRMNKWITYLKSHLKNVYTCRLSRLISLMASLWIYRKRFLRFLSDPDRLCCLPFWKSITASHILAGARHVARRTTEARSAEWKKNTQSKTACMCLLQYWYRNVT